MHNPWLPILTATLTWGGGSVATRYLLVAGVPSWSLLPVRYAVGTTTLVAAMAASRKLAAAGAQAWRRGAVLGVVNMALPTVFMTLGLQYLAASLSGILVALIPIATVLAAHLLVPGERFRPPQLPGLVVALVGVAILLGGNGGETTDLWRGVLLSLAGVATAGAGGALSRRFASTIPARQLVVPQFVTGTAVVLAAALPFDGYSELGAISSPHWLLLIALGALFTAVPFFSFLWATQITTAAQAGLTGYLVPVVSVVGGVTLLGEPFTWSLLVGGVVTLAGVLMVDQVERRLRVLARAAG